MLYINQLILYSIMLECVNTTDILIEASIHGKYEYIK